MSSPQVSVIIPAYNAEKTITQTLNSVFNQTYKSIEIIVVNDGSTDNTLEVLTKYQDKIHIISTENRGVSYARNLAFSKATGSYIQYLDADDLLVPNKIQIQVNALQANDADVAYGNWQRFTEHNGEIIYGEVISRQLQENTEIEIFTDFWCPPAALLYSSRIVQKIGVWKEWLPIIQDARYMLDAALNHGKFVYCPELVAFYRTGQENSLSNNNRLMFVKDCFMNARDIWDIWANNLTKEKKEAIIKCLRYCIHEFSLYDTPLFNEAVSFLLTIEPGYIPPQPGILKWLSILLGYRNTERIAAFKRKIWR